MSANIRLPALELNIETLGSLTLEASPTKTARKTTKKPKEPPMSTASKCFSCTSGCKTLIVCCGEAKKGKKPSKKKPATKKR